MARRTIQADLTTSSIESLIQQLESYKQEIVDKNVLFVEKLAKIGIPVIDTKIMQAQGDSDKAHDTEISVVSSADVTTATLKLSGKQILFIEFPTGIYYNNAVHHPKAAEFGYGVGTYGKSKTGRPSRGLYPGYWWYKGDDGNMHFSRGTECTMPMYSASLEIIRRVQEVAKEVFGND